MLNINQIYNEDCLSGMKKLPDGSIDFIFSDLPYGITNNSWDIPIPLDTIWKEFESSSKTMAVLHCGRNLHLTRHSPVAISNYTDMNGSLRKQKPQDI